MEKCFSLFNTLKMNLIIAFMTNSAYHLMYEDMKVKLYFVMMHIKMNKIYQNPKCDTKYNHFL